MRHDEIDITGTVRAILDANGSAPGMLLPALHAIQDALGFIPSEAVAVVADAFNLSRAEVHGVISFYHDFRTAPPPRHTIRICRAEACQSMGGDRVLAHAERAAGCGEHEHGADGGFSIEPVYCLGHCAAAAAIMIDDTPHARVTPAALDKLIENLKEPT